MTFLLGINAFSDLMNGQPQFVTRLSSLAPGDIVITCFTVWGEIRYGIERLAAGKRRQRLTDESEALIADVPCEPVPRSAGNDYAAIKLVRQRRGLSQDDNDAWIAATALALGAALVSRDQDMLQISALMVVDRPV